MRLKSEASAQGSGQPREWLGRGSILIGVLFLGAAILGYLAVNWLLAPALPDSIVGDWRIEGGDMNGTRVSFARDGTFLASVFVEGRTVEVKAHVVKEGDTLRFSFVNPQTSVADVKVQRIRSLTDREMVVEENHQSSRLVRIAVRE